MKATITKLFTDSGFDPELAEIKANEAIDIFKEFARKNSVDRINVRHCQLVDELIPRIEIEKNVTLFDEKEPF